jgi:hypothetical protein
MRTGPPLLAPIFRSDGQARLLSALLLTGASRASPVAAVGELPWL